MRFFTKLFLTVFCVLFINFVWAQGFLEMVDFGGPGEYQSLQTRNIATNASRVNLNTPNLGTVVREGDLIQIENEVLQDILNSEQQRESFTLSLFNDDYELWLMKAPVTKDDFNVFASSNRETPVAGLTAKFYWGVVKDFPGSFVSLSVFEDEIMAFITVEGEDYTLGKVENSTSHILYKNSDLLVETDLGCGVDETIHGIGDPSRFSGGSRDADNCVNMYVEVNHNIFLDKGSITASFNYVIGLFNQVAILYANELINFSVSEMVIWDLPSPYAGPSSSNFLTQFRDNVNGVYNGDLAHLVGYGGGGGVAYLDVLCEPYWGIGYSGINSSYQNVPTYSWSVMVVTHEIGHNLGSPHTHSCFWNGDGNAAIDGCGPQAGYSEGCEGPVPSSGTIMSYCHLIGGVGINLNNGFGTQPGNLIRDNVYNAPCLGDCEVASPPNNYDVHLVSINAPADLVCSATYSPQITVHNSGLITLTTLEIVYNVNGGADQTYNWAGSIATSTSANITLPSINTLAGTQVLNVLLQNPNGQPDQFVNNNDDSRSFSGAFQTATLPVSNTFEGAFPGVGWLISNPDNAITWVQQAVTNDPDCQSGSAARMNFYSYSAQGQTDDLLSPRIDLTGVSNPVLTFNHAHARYSAQYSDRLQVQISGDCGVNWTTLWDESGESLATAADIGSTYSPDCGEWSDESISLSSYVGQEVHIRFRATTGFGNDLFLDNINIQGACSAPVISSVSPSNVNCQGGQSVTLNGTFCGTLSLVVGGNTVPITSSSETQLTFTMPAGTGVSVPIVVTNLTGSANASISYNTPLIASYSPTSLNCSGGAALTITGTNLCNAVAVTVGGSNAPITSNTATSVVVTAPAGTGTQNIVVTTPSGVSNPLSVSYGAPLLASYSPTSLNCAGGAALTITGTNLCNAVAVTVGGSNAPITSNTATSVVVTAPAGTGTQNIVVTTPSGVSNPLSVSYGAPLLASYSPTSLNCAGGAALTITGTNLCNAVAVTVGGSNAPITSNTATIVVVTAPAGGGTNQPIVVTSPSGVSNSLFVNYTQTGCTNPAACNYDPNAVCDDGTCIESYDWTASAWGACSEECGGGVQTRVVTCQDCNGNTVANGLCAGVQPATTQACNTEPCCDNDWVVGAWGACSEECGGGIQTRVVTCQDCNGNTVANGLCAGVQPATTQACNTEPCCDNDWVVGAWGACSEECGGGIQTRVVTCQDCNGNTVANGLCSGVQPATTQACNTEPCCDNDWVVGAWGACSEECGGGVQTRVVTCQDCNGNTVANGLCSGVQPATTQACNTGPCDPVCDISLTSTTTSATLGFANGSATVFASGGQEPYTYLWNDSFEQTTATALGLFPGVYTCVVTDFNDCVETIQLTVGLQTDVPLTQVRAQFCNTAGYILSDVISCDIAAGATNYRWQFTPQGGSALPEYTRGSSNYNVRLSWVSGTQLGVTYEVRVKAFVNGQWGEYGPMCTITTTSNVPLTEVHPNWTPNNPNTNSAYGFCGVVTANSVAGAEAYGWELTGPNTLFAETSGYNLSLSSVAGLQLNTTYQVRVRVRFSGVWGAYGPIRPINMGMPPATVIIASQCNTTRTLNQAVAAANVCGAQYTFRFEHASEPERTLVRNVYTCPLWLMVPALTPGQTYQVSVNVTQGGISSGYGAACPITIAGPQAEGLAEGAMTVKSLETGSMALFPNPNFGSEVKLLLESIEEGTHNVNISVYDIFGKQISTEAFGYQGTELSHVLRFSNKLSAGIYTVHVVIDGNSFAVERMVVK